MRIAAGLAAAEIHAHTLASDGMVSAADLVRAAAAIGLSVLCITDHDTISELGPAIETGAALGVDVVRGEEVTAVISARHPHRRFVPGSADTHAHVG